MAKIYVDADACPVKGEVYAIAKRMNLIVHVVANQWMNMPDDPMIRLEVVDDGFDAADHWIVEKVGRSDVVVIDLLGNRVEAEIGIAFLTAVFSAIKRVSWEATASDLPVFGLTYSDK